MLSVGIVYRSLNDSMDGFAGVDLLPSLRRSLSSTNVAGCPIASSVETPLRRRVWDKHRGRERGSVELLFRRGAVHITAIGAMGRYAGAIHGSNSRKRSRRRRPGRSEFEDEQECSELELGNEAAHDASVDNHENFELCNNASGDRANGIAMKGSDRKGFDADVHVYDDIHGDFWPNNPYFQEMEATQGQKYFVQSDDVENGMARNEETMNPCPLQDVVSVSSVRVTEDHCSESLRKQEDCKDVHIFDIHNAKDMKDSIMSTAKKYQILNTARGKENFMVRETKNAERPVDMLGSLESAGSTEIEGRKSLGNAELDLGFSNVLYVSEYRTDGVGHGSSDGSGIPQNDLNDHEKLSLQKKSTFFESASEHQSANFHKSPPDPLTIFEEMSTAVSSLAAGIAEVPACHLLPEQVNGSVLKLENQMAVDIQRAEDIPTQVVELACPSMQDNENLTSFPTSGTVSLLPFEVVEQVAEIIPEPIKEHVGQVLNEVENIPSQVSQVAEQVVSKVVDRVVEALPDPVVEHIALAAEQIVEQVASHVVEPIANKASEITSFLGADEESDDSDDEFEAYRSSDAPEFKGIQGLNNFTILQEDQGILSLLYDVYIYMLKKPLPEFVLGMFGAPILLSLIFTLLYLPEFSGLALDDTVRQFFETSGTNVEEGQIGLQLSWMTVFQVFMFSVSLSTGLQPELSPLSPYTLVVANLNALIAQLIFVFLSGAVFARLSQPSQPVKCSTVALICPPPSIRKIRKEASYKVLMTRYVLVGPQPSELVDVKVDLTYKYNSVTRTGAFFRMTQPLKLVRPEIAYLTHGMLVRHIIDETSPLYHRSRKMLVKEDAVFSLSVVGLERSSMQSIFYVQHYSVYDGDVVWDAEFEDMILINKKNRRVVNHSLLSKWRPLPSE